MVGKIGGTRVLLRPCARLKVLSQPVPDLGAAQGVTQGDVIARGPYSDG